MTAHREERRQGDGPHAKAAVAGGSLSHPRIIALRHMPRNSGNPRRSALPLFHFWSLHVESAIRAHLLPFENRRGAWHGHAACADLARLPRTDSKVKRAEMTFSGDLVPPSCVMNDWKARWQGFIATPLAGSGV
jgi:hypothetical protein